MFKVAVNRSCLLLKDAGIREDEVQVLCACNAHQEFRDVRHVVAKVFQMFDGADFGRWEDDGEGDGQALNGFDTHHTHGGESGFDFG